MMLARFKTAKVNWKVITTFKVSEQIFSMTVAIIQTKQETCLFNRFNRNFKGNRKSVS